jgi:hypothetical protein
MNNVFVRRDISGWAEGTEFLSPFLNMEKENFKCNTLIYRARNPTQGKLEWQ